MFVVPEAAEERIAVIGAGDPPLAAWLCIWLGLRCACGSQEIVLAPRPRP